MIADKSWFKIKPQDIQMDEWYNPNNRTWQMYLNTVYMYQFSLFANAKIIATSEPTVSPTTITMPTTATVVEESALEYAALSMSADPVRANVVNGVVTPVTDGGDTTEPDNGNVNIPGSDVVNKAPSFVQELIAKLFEILSQIFSFLPVGEVM